MYLTLCDHLQSYEQAFEQIKEATGITDIDQLVTKFIEGMCSYQPSKGHIIVMYFPHYS